MCTRASRRKANDVEAAATQAAERAAEKAADRTAATLNEATKALDDVAAALSATLKEGREQFAPLLSDAQKRVAPLTKEAQQRIAQAQQRITPVVQQAAERVVPAYEAARDQVAETYHEDVAPRLAQLWDKAQENEYVAEATRRGSAAVAALKGEPAAPSVVAQTTVATHARAAEPRHRALRWTFRGLGLAALVAGVVVALRQLLLPKEDGWTPQQPSEPYIPEPRPDVDTADQATEEESQAVMTQEGGPATPAAEQAGEGDDLAAAAASTVPTQETLENLTSENVAGTAPEESATPETTPTSTQTGADPFRYGEGSFVGENPPEGYTIKGNERSMKYHMATGAGYERTNADVWFNSEQAAQQAGFSRASR